jgi:hypothetical protein
MMRQPHVAATFVGDRALIGEARPMTVEFLKDAQDYGDAYEILATGIRRMFLISPSIVRITFVRADIDYQGTK